MFSLNTLSQGTHTITATVSDTFGHTVNVAHTLNVLSAADAPSIDSAPTTSADWVLLTGSVTLSVSATDPNGDTLTYTWTVESGPGGSVFSVNGTTGSDTTIATPASAGTYVFQVAVSDSVLEVNDTVTVVVLSPTGDEDADGMTNGDEYTAA